ncbi:hypothetical protein PR202_gb07647 [Eleusine coracana subsp. coracana]|uniref:Uncharacterized protein n=1 Tax=Eleusine coracana subsp. coracana TaxID=191504 RepID=A0AAV5EAZ4_ELECO|nr:hypothetical protein PR202_gb07647 [Eleusine coracana subsp. coracana]
MEGSSSGKSPCWSFARLEGTTSDKHPLSPSYRLEGASSGKHPRRSTTDILGASSGKNQSHSTSAMGQPCPTSGIGPSRRAFMRACKSPNMRRDHLRG